MISAKEINWDDLGFDAIKTKSMFIAKCNNKGKWIEKGLIPYGPINILPSATVLNYGQGVFEGTKAYRTSKNNIVFFRLDENAKRFDISCKRLCIPKVPKNLFIDAIRKVVLDNIEYIPANGKGSLYIRPLILGTGPMLGVKPSDEYTFIVFVSPVGRYFKSGLKYLNAIVTNKYHRVATKSIGYAKAIGNYAGTLLPFKEIVNDGYDEIIFLNSSNENILDEARSANIFIIKNKVLFTPRIEGSILPGITRDSVLKIGKNILNLEVYEKDVSINDLISADEVFFTGTAVVIAPVGSIDINNNKYEYDVTYEDSTTKAIRENLLNIQNEIIQDHFGWIKRVQ